MSTDKDWIAATNESSMHAVLAKIAAAHADAVELDRLCEVMHDAYEKAAAGEGWETQQASRKPWSEVPPANQRTMRIAVRALLADLGIRIDPPAAPLAPGPAVENGGEQA